MKLANAPKFLTYDELVTELAQFEYRPGWNLSIYMHPWEGPIFRVVTKVPNSYDSADKPLELRINSAIPPIPSAEYFGHWLLWRLMKIEIHECQEFLKKNTVTLFDPHNFIEP